MANFEIGTGLAAPKAISLAQLSKLSAVPERRLRQLIGAGAISRASRPNSKAAYSLIHVREAVRARKLLAMGLSAQEVGAIAKEIDPRGFPPPALRLHTIPDPGEADRTWSAGRVTMTIPASCSASEARLIEAIRKAVHVFAIREKDIRRVIRPR